MTSHGASLMLIVHVLTLMWLAIAEVRPQKQTQGHRYIVPLKQERVPVLNDDLALSFKNVYYGSIFVGAPDMQAFTVLFDTGSGHLILPSVACKTESCTVHNQYAHERSALGVAVDSGGSPIEPGAPRDEISVAFGTGEVTGQLARDRMCLGTTSKPNSDNATEAQGKPSNDALEQSGCFDMHVVTATKMSHEPFASFSFDGVLGLGLDSLALAPEFSFMSMLAAHGNLASRSFGIFLADSDDDFSEISFGGHNTERISSEIAWAPLAMPEEGHWMVPIRAIRIGGKAIDFCGDGQCRAVIDSGTSTIAMPSSLSGKLVDELKGSLQDPSQAAIRTTGCKQANGEDIEFDIEGATLTLGPGEYARASVQMSEADGEEEEAAAMALLDGSDGGDRENRHLQAKCHPTFMPLDLPGPLGPKLFILGEPVLRKYYTVYDGSKMRIGFAMANQKPKGKDTDTRAAPPPLIEMV